MNMFARFNENPAMTLQDIKETKCYGRTDGRTDAQTTWKQYTPYKQSLRGYNIGRYIDLVLKIFLVCWIILIFTHCWQLHYKIILSSVPIKIFYVLLN